MFKKQRLTILFSIFFLFNPTIVLGKEVQPVGAVATAHPLATKAGLEVLEKGGNAFDAAVAIASTLNVVEPTSSGLGGYGLSLIYDAKKKEIRFLNGSGKFPLNTNSDFMRPPVVDYLKNRKGPKSISTPGNLNAWKEMHEKYGKLPWSDLFNDAIRHAKTGFRIPPYTARLIADSFNEFTEHSKSIYGKDGLPLQEGDLLIQNDLAKTYEIIASKGVHPFYHGEIAAQINKQMKALGSFLSIEDLRADVAEWWDPFRVNYKGYNIYTIGTPGNGFTALFTVGVMEQLPLQQLKHNSPEYLHALAEVLKESCKVRLTNSGSLEETNNIVNNILTSHNFLTTANSIDMIHSSHFDMHSHKEGANTTHFVVVDKWGNIVSSTQTLGTGFGSKVMIEGTGIWMNNSMAYSNFEPKNNPMDALPGKYKLSSNSPIIIMKDGKAWATLGTPGGHTIPQNTAQIIINLIDFNMNMQEAIDAPKIAFFDEKSVICAEREISTSIIESLIKKGHIIDSNIESYIGLSGKIGNAMGIKLLYDRKDISFDVGVDKRKDGWSTTHNISK